MRRRHRHHRSWRRGFRPSTVRMALLLIVGLVVAAGVLSLLPGAQDLFSAIMNIPDAMTFSEMERKARAGR